MKIGEYRKPGCIAFFVLILTFGSLAADYVQAQSYNSKYAVVIGINKYSHRNWPNLTYARNDAEGVAKLMKQLGFTIYSLYDDQATKLEIISLLEDQLAPRLRKDDALLVFFAGHGATRELGGKDRGYIVPSDASDRYASLISMEEIRTLSDKMSNAKHQAFIMDCCYGGLISTRNVIIPNTHPYYLQEIGKRTARQILTAGGKDQVVADGGLGGHSVFTGYLIKGINQSLADVNGDNWITFSELANYLQSTASTSMQTPMSVTLSGHEGGEFLFRAPPPARTPVVESTEPPPESRRNSTPTTPLPHFRSAGTTLSYTQAKEMVVGKGFYDESMNEGGKGIRHRYRPITREGKQLVVDDATGLMWQRSGSDKLIYWAAQQYIQDLNNNKFAGYGDWRLPTLEEAMSLVESTKKSNDLYINSVFDKWQRWIWTADKTGAGAAWYVGFYDGYCYTLVYRKDSFVRAVRLGQ